MFGDEDPMQEFNKHEQESKYGLLRQGEREFITTFKARFDEQVAANLAVGIAPVSDCKRALDFLGKLDPRRYKKMHFQMKNDALRRKPEAFPTSLASAFRIVSQWYNDDFAHTPTPVGANAAYVTEAAHVTATNDPDKKAGKGGKTGGAKKKSPTDVKCFLCEAKGHYARNCPQRKSSGDKAHVTAEESDSDYEGEPGEWGVALVATDEKCCFSRYDVLLDNEASLNIFNNADLLTDIRKSERSIKVSGIQVGGGVSVDREGEFGDFGTVYYSGSASANILSFASQVDAGATIRHDHVNDCFTLQPKGSTRTYSFGRKLIIGSEGRFYSCDWREFQQELALVTTVTENLKAFTKREIEGARRARELLARMGFPTVEQAMAIVNSGSNFDVSSRDFQITDAIFGKDIASLKGKTIKISLSAQNSYKEIKCWQSILCLSTNYLF